MQGEEDRLKELIAGVLMVRLLLLELLFMTVSCWPRLTLFSFRYDPASNART